MYNIGDLLVVARPTDTYGRFEYNGLISVKRGDFVLIIGMRRDRYIALVNNSIAIINEINRLKRVSE